MSVEELVDLEAMSHIANFGCIKNMDAYAQFMLKTSEHPLMRFRRDWMRRTALQQHLEAERRQKKMNSAFKAIPKSYGSKNIRQEAVIDNHLAAEMRHYANADLPELKRAMKAEAPAIFPKRD